MTFLGWLSDPFKGLRHLQLGDQKVTLNHLADVLYSYNNILLFHFVCLKIFVCDITIHNQYQATEWISLRDCLVGKGIAILRLLPHYPPGPWNIDPYLKHHAGSISMKKVNP